MSSRPRVARPSVTHDFTLSCSFLSGGYSFGCWSSQSIHFSIAAAASSEPPPMSAGLCFRARYRTIVLLSQSAPPPADASWSVGTDGLGFSRLYASVLTAATPASTAAYSLLPGARSADAWTNSKSEMPHASSATSAFCTFSDDGRPQRTYFPPSAIVHPSSPSLANDDPNRARETRTTTTPANSPSTTEDGGGVLPGAWSAWSRRRVNGAGIIAIKSSAPRAGHGNRTLACPGCVRPDVIDDRGEGERDERRWWVVGWRHAPPLHAAGHYISISDATRQCGADCPPAVLRNSLCQP